MEDPRFVMQQKQVSLLQEAEASTRRMDFPGSTLQARRERELQDRVLGGADMGSMQRREEMFRRYDRDGDGLLNAKEIKAYVASEHPGVDLPSDFFKELLQSNLSRGLRGVSRTQFSKLESQIVGELRKRKIEQQSSRLRENAAEAATAIDGVEAEVAKAEVEVKALGALDIESMSERIEESRSIVDAAKDFLSAATEKVTDLGVSSGETALEPEVMWLLGAESKRLGLGALEARVKRSLLVVGQCHTRVLQHKKSLLPAKGN